jgi:hypothetical protein
MHRDRHVITAHSPAIGLAPAASLRYSPAAFLLGPAGSLASVVHRAIAGRLLRALALNAVFRGVVVFVRQPFPHVNAA